MIRREKITVNVTNNDELEFALKRKNKNPIEVELWSKSKTGKYFLAICGASYAVFEKSPDDDLNNTPSCRYVGSTSVRIENEECYADDIVWCEHGGCMQTRQAYAYCGNAADHQNSCFFQLLYPTHIGSPTLCMQSYSACVLTYILLYQIFKHSASLFSRKIQKIYLPRSKNVLYCPIEQKWHKQHEEAHIRDLCNR